jgi:diacylglycerol O-acyltransferase
MSSRAWPRGRTASRRVAMYTQLHHAAVDGQAAVALANALLDLTPRAARLELKPSRRQKVFKLEMTEMLRGVIASQARRWRTSSAACRRPWAR